MPTHIAMTKSVLLLICLLATIPVSAQGPQTASDFVARGEGRFQANDIAGSVRDFQRAIELEPRIEPRLWQLGISYYYAGQFKKGRQLFESHRTVNPHDVENAAWHFLCVARVEGVDAAQKQIIKIDTRRDRRVPMTEIYELYAGRGSVDAVLKAARQADTQRALMYAHLYVGLYFEVAEDEKQSRVHLRKSAAAELTRNYMHDVAKVHLLQRKWKP